MKFQLRYGINPQEVGEIEQNEALGDVLRILDGTLALSATNLVDIFVGLRALGSVAQGASYVKHGCLVGLSAGTNRSLGQEIEDAAKAAGHIDFGVFVLRGVVTEEIWEILRHLHFHVLVASDFAPSVAEFLEKEATQHEMRGLSVAIFCWDSFDPFEIRTEAITLIRNARLVNRFSSPTPGALRVRSNAPLTKEEDARVGWYQLILRDMRTISSFLIEEDRLIKGVYGFQDSLESLDYLNSSPRPPSLQRPEASWLVTDGCFGPKSPEELLSRVKVQNVLLCGKKNQREDMFEAFQKRGIRLVVTDERFFCHL